MKVPVFSKERITGPFCSFYFFLSLFSISGFANAGASETQRLGFIQGFYYKNKGRGRVVHTREGRAFCKIKIGRKIKFKIHIHNNCFYGRGTYPEVRELQCLLQNTYNDLKKYLKIEIPDS